MVKKCLKKNRFRLKFIYKPRPIKLFMPNEKKSVKIICDFPKLGHEKIIKLKIPHYYKNCTNIEESYELLNLLFNATLKAVNLEINRKNKEKIFNIEKVVKKGKEFNQFNVSTNSIFGVLFNYSKKV